MNYQALGLPTTVQSADDIVPEAAALVQSEPGMPKGMEDSEHEYSEAAHKYSSDPHTSATDDIAGVIDDESDYGKGFTDDKVYWDPVQGRHRVKSPGYTTEDSSVTPDGHLILGNGRRRIGAGFGRRRAPVYDPSIKPNVTDILDTDKLLKNHPDVAEEMAKFHGSPASSPSGGPAPPLSEHDQRKLLREIMGLKSGPTYFAGCNYKGAKVQSTISMPKISPELTLGGYIPTIGSMHIPAGWCVTLFSKRDFEGKSFELCGPKDEWCTQSHHLEEGFSSATTEGVRTKHTNWMHPGSLKVHKFRYQQHQPPLECSDECGHPAREVEGNITCLRQHGGEAIEVSTDECAAHNISRPPALTKTCPKTHDCADYATWPSTSDCPENCGEEASSLVGTVHCYYPAKGEWFHAGAPEAACEAQGVVKPAPPIKDCPATPACPPPPTPAPTPAPTSCVDAVGSVEEPVVRFSSGPLASRPSEAHFVAEVDFAVAATKLAMAAASEASEATPAPAPKPSGFCTSSGSLAEVANHLLCAEQGGGKKNIAFKYEVEWSVAPEHAGEWHFDFNVDFGWGGIVYFDGKPSHEGFQSGDHWWSMDLHRALPLDLAHSFSPGRHNMTVYGAEGCCDGSSHVSFKVPGDDSWTVLTKEALHAVGSGPVAPRIPGVLKFSTGEIKTQPAAETFANDVELAVAHRKEGWCSKEVDSLARFSNHETCGGPSTFIGFKLEAEFRVPEDQVGEWHFDFNVDFGWGGIVYFDGKPSHEGFQSGDHWWSMDHSTPLPLDIAHTFETSGTHNMTVYGAEGCCDGSSGIRFKKYKDTEWHDLSSEELSVPGPIPPPCPPSIPSCKPADPDSTLVKCFGSDNCYAIVTDATDFTTASCRCQHMEGSLACPSNATEYNTLTEWWRSATDVEEWDAKLWLGITDTVTEGKWTCQNGDSYYEHWQPGEPNDHGSGEDCGEISKNGGYKLEDMKCSRALPYVCTLPYHRNTPAPTPLLTDEPCSMPFVEFQSGKLEHKPSEENFVEAVKKATRYNLYDDGYCSAGGFWSGGLSSFSNHEKCDGGSRKNVAYVLTAEFSVLREDAGEWHFDFNVDFGWGGIVYFDGKPSHEGFQSGDHWWNNDLSKALPLDLAHSFSPGRHNMTVYGAEGCCDGTSHVRFKKPGDSKWRLVDIDELACPGGWSA